MTLGEFYVFTDTCGMIATAVMLYLTEPNMPETKTETTEQRVHSMLDDAVANGYDVSTWTVDDIVADLLAYADLTDEETEEAIRPHVIAWKQVRVPI